MRFLTSGAAAVCFAFLAVVAACGGNVVRADGGGTGASGSANPWIVPGPCTYACDGKACPTPCGPDQTPGAEPYTCCDGSGTCETPVEPAAGVTAMCPACLPGWTPSPDMALFCCMDMNCYSPATGTLDVAVFAAGAACKGGDGTCGCSLPSQDGHTYALVCEAGACACEEDGTMVKSVAWLCTASGALDSAYLTWACGFPPI